LPNDIFMTKYKYPYGIRICKKNFGFKNRIKSVPLFAFINMRLLKYFRAIKRSKENYLSFGNIWHIVFILRIKRIGQRYILFALDHFPCFFDDGISVFILVALQHIYIDIGFHAEFDVFFFGIKHGRRRKTDRPTVGKFR